MARIAKKSAKKSARKAAKPVTRRSATSAAPATRRTGAAAGKRQDPADLRREVEELLYRQSAHLDAKRWQAWIDLFAPDGIYWMPPAEHYTTWDGQPSIFIEDRDMMAVRMKRVQHPHAWSQAAEWSTSHVVSNIEIEKVGPGGDVHVLSRFHMMELRRDDLRHFGGTYRHHLVRTPRGLRIKLQRVDLFNAQAPFEYVLQVWV